MEYAGPGAGGGRLHRGLAVAQPGRVPGRPLGDRRISRRKWDRELDYSLRKDLWAVTDDRIAVRFQYESRDASGRWWRSYGNELWEFDAEGYMRRREASINDVPIDETDRRISGRAPIPSATHRCRWRERHRPRARAGAVRCLSRIAIAR